MSYLKKIKENNNYTEEDKIPFVIDNQRVGQVRKDYLAYILSSDVFELKDEEYIAIVQGQVNQSMGEKL